MRERTFPEIAKLVFAYLDDVRDIPPERWWSRGRCDCGYDLRDATVTGYPHPGGWDTPLGKYWLFIRCPHCGHETPLWQIGFHKGIKFEVI